MFISVSGDIHVLFTPDRYTYGDNFLTTHTHSLKFFAQVNGRLNIRLSEKFILTFVHAKSYNNVVKYHSGNPRHVQASNDVFLALAWEPGNTQVQTYEILIGGANNQESEIRDGVSSEAKITVPTQGILNPNEMR